MVRLLKRGTVLLVLVATAAAGLIYATARPYQQDRILIGLGFKAR